MNVQPRLGSFEPRQAALSASWVASFSNSAGEPGPEREVGADSARRQVAFEFAFPPMPHQLGQRDLHRADALALAAEGGRVGQMSRLLDADQGWRQHAAHRPRIDPTIGVPAHRAIDRAVVHAGGAADAAQHLLELGAEDVGAAVVEEDDVELFGSVEIAWPAGTGRDGGVDRELLAGGRARQQTQDRRRVLESGNQLLQARQHDVDASAAICVRSPLPSLVTMMVELPVSAIRKLAPVMPTSAARKPVAQDHARLGRASVCGSSSTRSGSEMRVGPGGKLASICVLC